MYIPIILPMKGIAALLVAIYYMAFTFGLFAESEYVSKTGLFGNHGVELFFLISGLVIPLSMIGEGYKFENVERFFLNRSIRIEPPHMTSVALGTIFVFSRQNIFHDGAIPTPTFAQIISNIFYFVPFNQEAWISLLFWTLAVELQFYAFCSLLSALNLRWKPQVLLPLVFLCSILFRKIFSGHAMFPSFIDCFMVGFIAEIHKLEKHNLRQLIYGLDGLCLIMFFTRSTFVSFIEPFGTNHCLFPSSKRLIDLRFLGRQSYSLYLTYCLTRHNCKPFNEILSRIV